MFELNSFVVKIFKIVAMFAVRVVNVIILFHLGRIVLLSSLLMSSFLLMSCLNNSFAVMIVHVIILVDAMSE